MINSQPACTRVVDKQCMLARLFSLNLISKKAHGIINLNYYLKAFSRHFKGSFATLLFDKIRKDPDCTTRKTWILRMSGRLKRPLLFCCWSGKFRFSQKSNIHSRYANMKLPHNLFRGGTLPFSVILRMCGRNGWVFEAIKPANGVNFCPKTCEWVIILISKTSRLVTISIILPGNGWVNFPIVWPHTPVQTKLKWPPLGTCYTCKLPKPLWI